MGAGFSASNCDTFGPDAPVVPFAFFSVALSGLEGAAHSGACSSGAFSASAGVAAAALLGALGPFAPLAQFVAGDVVTCDTFVG